MRGSGALGGWKEGEGGGRQLGAFFLWGAHACY